MSPDRIITEPDEDFDILGDLDVNPLAGPAARPEGAHVQEAPATEARSGEPATSPAHDQDVVQAVRAFAQSKAASEAAGGPAKAAPPAEAETPEEAAPPAGAEPVPPVLTGADSLSFRRMLAKAMERGAKELTLDFSGVEDMDGDALTALARLERAGVAIRVDSASEDMANLINRLIPGHNLF